MACFQKTFTIKTQKHNAVHDITFEVKRILKDAECQKGQVCVFTPHATAAITINENDDPNIGVDFLRALQTVIIEHDNWLHDRIDNNAAAHIKSALIGPSVTIPLYEGRLCLGTWQDIFFCEFDGPRQERKIIVSVIS